MDSPTYVFCPLVPHVTPEHLLTDRRPAAGDAGDARQVPGTAVRQSELVDDATTNRTAPIRIGTDTKWTATTAGDLHTIGFRS